ncbi:MAG: cob(I)yrinic acid a,c-diamide adenosyltransferase [Gammaproteobacteria bacterium]|nr:cob(I)yrinic acid a,c-diamide adenosyltransferase [Gammaproteobacteria bacterium]MCW9004462.1 cob(I)yrinic acid a,c-diamide adenosyltransferase [Gammaproteobacteria bacterium]MCW9056297.1 cob(I)yrinic acid a,c-diamide adenosyltransferase [Gammaproteobacteria bacterium]
MGYRLSKIYTRTGDKGTTGMADGSRIDKDSLRVAAMGDIDELNSVLGMVLARCKPGRVSEMLLTIQHDLFNLGGQLSMPDYNLVTEDRVQWLESTLDEMNKDLSPLKEFILPGGGDAAATCHLARAVCRRAERTVVALAREYEFSNTVKSYINRLSDLLFVTCRVLSKEAGEDEVYWQSERLKK